MFISSCFGILHTRKRSTPGVGGLVPTKMKHKVTKDLHRTHPINGKHQKMPHSLQNLNIYVTHVHFCQPPPQNPSYDGVFSTIDALALPRAAPSSSSTCEQCSSRASPLPGAVPGSRPIWPPQPVAQGSGRSASTYPHQYWC